MCLSVSPDRVLRLNTQNSFLPFGYWTYSGYRILLVMEEIDSFFQSVDSFSYSRIHLAHSIRRWGILELALERPCTTGLLDMFRCAYRWLCCCVPLCLPFVQLLRVVVLTVCCAAACCCAHRLLSCCVLFCLPFAVLVCAVVLTVC